MASYDWSTDAAQFLHMDAAGTSDFGGVITSIGSYVQAQIETFIGRTLGQNDYDEYYDGRDRPKLFLLHGDVVSVTSLTINGATKVVGSPASASTACVLGVRRDFLQMVNGGVFPAGIQNVRVVYKAGIDPASGDGQLFIGAARLWIAAIFKNRDNAGRTSSVLASGQQTNYSHAMPPAVKDDLIRLQRAAVPTC